MRKRYRARLSGPLLDRLDIHVSVPPVDVSALTGSARGESSAAVRARVTRARELQRGRATAAGTRLNAALAGTDLERFVELDRDAKRLVETAVDKLGLSARGFVKVLRVARTIADLDGEAAVRSPQIAEAIQGRLFDREVMG